ncbi:tyrosine-type recombinase/integrase, partial [Roseisolibacter sp. H3M3-2]|uniref:tyrosine-type recombinase/integrase n=1 Tax=Roseisolibacter sp. H3M3-2 TaxID=3031323 RepID=UPI0023DCC256
DAEVRLAVHLLYYTAQRIGDVVSMRWSDVRDGRIHVVQEKTGTTVEIPLHHALAEELARAPRRALTILAGRGSAPRTRGRLRQLLQAFARDRGFKVVPHGLRKNAVNALLEAGCSAAETAAISGQSLQMVEHYAKLRSQKTLAEGAILKWNARRTGKPNGKPA